MSEAKKSGAAATAKPTAIAAPNAPATPAPHPPATSPKGMMELKVSGHLMSFDAGLYCIFNPPGSPVPDNATGLPGVRVSLPPGPAFHPEAVTISTFRDDGWLGGPNGAALVRVTRGPAQLLVTIYQAPGHTGDAPKLQILRLAEGTTAPQTARAAAAPPGAAPVGQIAPAQAPAPVAAVVPQNTPAGGAAAADVAGAEIVAHVQTRGDVTATLGSWMGIAGSKHWIEGFSLTPRALVGAGDIEYQAVLGRGWLSPWAEGGQFCGSRGMSLPILGLRVRLKGEAAERFDCVLTASFVDGTKIGPLDNGEPAQAESLAPLEAFLIELKPHGTSGAKKPAAKAPAPAKPAPAPVKPAAKGTAKRK